MAGYRRVLLKISGEALAGDRKFGIASDASQRICGEIAALREHGTQIAVVIGGGNIFRGITSSAQGVDRVTADYMGMLGTVINALAVQDTLEKMSVPARIMSSIPIEELTEPFIRRKAIHYLEQGQIVIFAGGTGNPYFSTDTAASLRAAQIGAEAIFKGTKVDGVYDADPVHNPGAVRFDVISFDEVLNRDLRIMDATAIAMCRENAIPIVVFNLAQPHALIDLVDGKPVGTLVKENAHG